MSIYLENFKTREDVMREFEITPEALEGAKILMAWYGYGSYCGDSFVLFERAGKLYTVEGGHCSCYGLEGQWEPQETSWEALNCVDIDDYCDGSDNARVTLKLLVEQNLPSAKETN